MNGLLRLLSVCHSVSHPDFLALQLNSTTHHIISILTPSCSLSLHNPSSTRVLIGPPTPTRLHTREGDVESLKRYGEVRNKAQLGLEVAIQAGINWCGPLWAGKSSQRLCEAAIFCYQEIVVVILQVEGMESELDTLKKKRESQQSDKNSIWIKCVARLHIVNAKPSS